MFPTGGYFKGVVCPYYEHGLCHRATYCHYKHVKPLSPAVSNTVTQEPITKLHPLPTDSCHDDPKATPPLVSDIFGSSDSDNDIHSPDISIATIDDQQTTPIINKLFGSDSDDNEVSMATETPPTNAEVSMAKETLPTNDEVSMATETPLTQEDVQAAFIKAITVQPVGIASKPSYENKGIKKTRIAHSNAKSSLSVSTSSKSVVNKNLSLAIKDPKALYVNRKRQSHSTTASSSNKGSRPRIIPSASNTKVPAKLRQGYLDKFIDELIKTGIEPTQAYKQCLEQEESIYNHSTSSTVYRNLSSHRLKTLRDSTRTLLDNRRRISDQRVAQHMEGRATTSKDGGVVHDDVGGATPDVGGVKEVVETTSTSELISSNKFYSVVKRKHVTHETTERSKKGKIKSASSHTHSFESLLMQADEINLKKKNKLKSTHPWKPSEDNVIVIEDTPANETTPTDTIATGEGKEGGDSLPQKRKSSEEAGDSLPRKRKGSDSSKPYSPPSPTSLINLTELANKRTTPTLIKAPKCKIDIAPPKPRPQPSFSIIKKKEPDFNVDVFYNQLLEYSLSEEQLVQFGYPRATEQGTVASIKLEPDRTRPAIEPIGESGMRHTCSRCGKSFIIYNNGSYQSVDECVYHYGKMYRMKEYGEGWVLQYSCCGGRTDATGCQVAQMHVTEGEQRPTISGCVQSAPPPSSHDYIPQIYALDCEMCYTTLGLELARITVIDWTLHTVYETLVKPSHTIVDYNTRFSGLSAEDFIGVTVTLSDVQDHLLALFYEDTILIGHSLDSDLKALKFIHSTVVDTSIVFPHRKGLPYKRALKSLATELLHKFIQDSVDGGHDSREDSIVCMELMIMKVKSDLKQMKTICYQ